MGISGVLSACQTAQPKPDPVSVVASSRYNEYTQPVFAQRKSSEVVSNWLSKEVGEQQQMDASSLEQKIATLIQENKNLKVQLTEQQTLSEKAVLDAVAATKNQIKQAKTQLSSLWGTPTGAVGQGVTVMDYQVRSRLNDALNTTPLDGEARWRQGSRSFIVKPNSEIYQPYRSGGNCRDAIFIHYATENEETVRGLFCQSGRGADWFLVR